MGRESAPCRPEHLGEVVFIWDLSDNDLCLTSIFGGTASIHCGSRFPGRNGTFRHRFGQIIPTVRRSPSFSHAQSLPGLQLFMLRSDLTVRQDQEVTDEEQQKVAKRKILPPSNLRLTVTPCPYSFG
jgi:hypothetical protein